MDHILQRRCARALVLGILFWPQPFALAYENMLTTDASSQAQQHERDSRHAEAQVLAVLPSILAPYTKLVLPPIEAAPPPAAISIDIYSEAIKRLNQRIKTRPTGEDYLERGRIYALKSDFPNAIKDLTKAIFLRKDLVEVFKLRGYCYASQDKYKDAEADYSRFLQHKPKDVPIWVALGACYDRDGQPLKAIDSFNHAIAIEPKESTFYAFNADVYGRMSKYDKALEVLNQGLKVDPKSKACLYESAYMKELRKDKDGALKEFDKLIAEFPDFVQARKERAIICEEKQEYQKALEDYDKCLELVQTSASRMLDGAIKKAEKTDILGGAMDMTAALSFYPEKIYFLRKRSEAYRSLRRFDEALSDADYAVALAPKNALAVMQRAYVEFSMERTGASITDFDKVLALEPKEDTAYWGRAFAYCVKGEYKNAAVDFDKYSTSSVLDQYTKYCFVYEALMLKLAGQKDQLPSLYTKAAAKLKHTEWPYPFLDYLNGKMTLAELTVTADSNDKQTELHCFLALDAMADKKPEKAKEEFQWVLDKGNKDFFEYTLSLALIKKV